MFGTDKKLPCKLIEHNHAGEAFPSLPQHHVEQPDHLCDEALCSTQSYPLLQVWRFALNLCSGSSCTFRWVVYWSMILLLGLIHTKLYKDDTVKIYYLKMMQYLKMDSQITASIFSLNKVWSYLYSAMRKNSNDVCIVRWAIFQEPWPLQLLNVLPHHDVALFVSVANCGDHHLYVIFTIPFLSMKLKEIVKPH